MEEQILINVKLDAKKVSEDLRQVGKDINNLKKEQQDNKKAFEEGAIEYDEYSAKLAVTKSKMSELQKKQKALADTTKYLTRENENSGDSIVDLRQNLKELQNAYALLSKEQREGAAGEQFRMEIKRQSDELKGLEAGIGDMRRNVGNYKESFVSAFNATGVSVGNFGKSMKLLMNNPWSVVLMVVVQVIQKLQQSFKSSEDRMNEFRAALAPLQGVLDVITQMFDLWAKTVGQVLVAALKKGMDVVKWAVGYIDKIAAKMGKNLDLMDTFTEKASTNSAEAIAAQQNYQKHARKWITEQAQLENDIAKLKDKALQKDRYTVEERILFMEEALKKEGQIAAEREKLARENLQALELEAARSENDAEMNNKLQEARAAVTRANTDYFNSTRRIQTQLQTFKAEQIKNDLQDVAESTAEVVAKNVESTESIKEEQKSYEDLLKRIKSWSDTEISLLEEQYQTDIQMSNLTAEQKQKIEKHYQEERKRLNREAEDEIAASNVAAMQAKADAVDMWTNKAIGAFTAMSNAANAIDAAELADYEAKNRKERSILDKRLEQGRISQEEYNARVSQMELELDGKKAQLQDRAAKREKAANIFSATISTATAIIRALADPGGFAGIALSAFAAITGAAQLAAIVAQPLPSQSFADGGIVRGAYDRRDNIPVNLSGNEMIINPIQQKELFAMANGQLRGETDYTALAEAVGAAFEKAPAPVLEFEEFVRFDKRQTQIKEEITI